MKALIVEDELLARLGMRSLIDWESLGITLLEDASDGAEALKKIEKEQPDLILLDLGLPDIDGGEVLERVRGFSAVPVIVISARTQEGEKVQALDKGADDYITKPFGSEELLARIRTALRHSAQTVSYTHLTLPTNSLV